MLVWHGGRPVSTVSQSLGYDNGDVLDSRRKQASVPKFWLLVIPFSGCGRPNIQDKFVIPKKSFKETNKIHLTTNL